MFMLRTRPPTHPVAWEMYDWTERNYPVALLGAVIIAIGIAVANALPSLWPLTIAMGAIGGTLVGGGLLWRSHIAYWNDSGQCRDSAFGMGEWFKRA